MATNVDAPEKKAQIFFYTFIEYNRVTLKHVWVL